MTGNMTSKEISQRLKEVQDFFSAPETPNQLAWGYAHMINHWLLTRDKSMTPHAKRCGHLLKME